jgi:hypothetical protein
MDKKYFESKLLINANGEKINGVAEGSMHLPTGEVVVTHDYEKTPEKFDLGFLTVGALTGIPEPKRAIGPVVNPFPDSEEFDFERTVNFIGSDCTLLIKGGYKSVAPDKRVGYLEFVGTVPELSKIIKVEPTVETWTPGISNNITGSFVMSWLTSNGKRVIAQAKTSYVLKNSPDMVKFKVPHFRYITIQFAINKNIYRQEEQISLFQSPTEHVDRILTLSKQIEKALQ